MNLRVRTSSRRPEEQHIAPPPGRAAIGREAAADAAYRDGIAANKKLAVAYDNLLGQLAERSREKEKQGDHLAAAKLTEESFVASIAASTARREEGRARGGLSENRENRNKTERWARNYDIAEKGK